MLQQTRVETVIPYFEAWMNKFPTVHALAEAPEQKILAAWEGLGYYHRARNMHKAAKILVKEFGGYLPGDITRLRALPGVGEYTAAAISSIAFGLDAAALDGNIKRIYARIYRIKAPVDEPDGLSTLRWYAEANLPHGQAGEFNQALMDLGSMICLPGQPDCGRCPLVSLCEAYTTGEQAILPLRRIMKAIPHHTIVSAVIRKNNTYLLAQRPPDRMLGGMWEFPGGKVEAGESHLQALEREMHEELSAKILVGEPLGVYRHAYTHFRITLHAYCCTLRSRKLELHEADQIAWVTPEDMVNYPMGKVDRLIARRLMEDG
jgi:A/G-specific adenine glycosylase